MFELPPSADPELLKTLLSPLLDDFDYWFSRSQSLLESERIEFLAESEQQGLHTRVVESLAAVRTMRTLMSATQAGVEMSVLMEWHKLVHECWGVSMKHRQLQNLHE